MLVEAKLMITPTTRLTGLCLWMCIFAVAPGQATEPQSLSPDTPVARVGGSTIPFVELPGQARAKLAQQQRDFESQAERLALSTGRARDAELQNAVGHLVEAGVCARAQGKFWEMHDALYAEQNLLGEKALKEKAVCIGLDAKKFDECLDSGGGTTTVKTDEQDGIKLALTGAHLEAAFIAMVDRHHRGRPPATFKVAALR
jgi:hypothetical protein